MPLSLLRFPFPRLALAALSLSLSLGVVGFSCDAQAQLAPYVGPN